jgi:hypothetical protein
MVPRCLVLLVVLYVSLDFANPWIPGAFVFDSDESVDALVPRRDLPVIPETGASRSAVKLEPRALEPEGALPARPLSGWLVERKRAHAPSPDLSPPAEDD